MILKIHEKGTRKIVPSTSSSSRNLQYFERSSAGAFVNANMSMPSFVDAGLALFLSAGALLKGGPEVGEVLLFFFLELFRPAM